MSPLTESTRLTLAKTWDLAGFDADAAAYIQRVEWADTTPLESATRTAINNFVVGCKADGIWTAIKASCILAGARTLAGALMPLAGAAPINFNFASGDYNRKTGLVGNGGGGGSTKLLNTNRNNTADPQNSRHACVWVTEAGPFSENMRLIAAGNTASNGDTNLTTGGVDTTWIGKNLNATCASTPNSVVNANAQLGFIGINRSISTSFTVSNNSNLFTVVQTSSTPQSKNYYVFAIVGDASAQYFGGRIAFYSIGESLGQNLLSARVSALITAFGVAIP
jgi:hypothetical protein